jgi:hypothetical protein
MQSIINNDGLNLSLGDLGLMHYRKALEKKIVLYLEGTSYPSISHLENGWDLMPIPQ